MVDAGRLMDSIASLKARLADVATVCCPVPPLRITWE